MTSSITVWNWFNEVEQGGWAKQRKDGDLVIYNQESHEQARFRFLGGWPTTFKISDVKAGGKDFSIEEMELAVEEFTRVK
jgi:phage tail-like protein